MSKMISVASDFQYSVNIGYDLNNENKIKNFIPTASAMNLLEDILYSTLPSSSERARILIGAYGKGKSHIMLMILNMLMKKDINLFAHILSKCEGTKLYQSIYNYYDSNNKILPVIITGSNTSLTQSFILALQRTLSSNDLLDVMPETNYKAAAQVIQRWKNEFPETYKKFCEHISLPIDVFIEKLQDYDSFIYKEFEEVYPILTAGSVFNPFLGYDVVELYESAAKGLREKGYSGIFVVYDEFSKYLETNITATSVSDTKMLQDFAEKCNRSETTQMHIMLISHKEIANYIDVLPKQKVDGWRGVSERFLHVRLSNNFTQTYEIIESVIHKDPNLWRIFYSENKRFFELLENRYLNHPIFSDVTEEGIRNIIAGCYPLHPISTFILPRLSERVAQNERTLFTFLSANGVSTLPSFLDIYDDKEFLLITPDKIYDYFEPLFRKEIYSGSLHDNYILTETILEKLEPDSLDCKIVKCISLIYLLEQFEKLRPTKEELYGIFSEEFSHEEIETSINRLIEKEFVIYLKRSNGYLQLKQTSGINVQQKISDLVESQRQIVTVEDGLNKFGFDSYLYPSRYNEQHEMVRYFSFHFVDVARLEQIDELERIINSESADGIILGILPNNQDSIQETKEKLTSLVLKNNRVVFVLPKNYKNIDQIVREYNAAVCLRDQTGNDEILFDEYEIIYEDLRDSLISYISSFTHPELYQSDYYWNGEKKNISRRSALSELLSQICDKAYGRTPVVNNEALNRNEATSMARNSRNKVVAGLLRTSLEPNLGLSGTGQEVSIMRSTLVRTGILENIENEIHINLHPSNNPEMSGMLGEIEAFINESRENGTQSFSKLYYRLCSAENKIAIRRELIPIYLAAVLHEYRQQIVVNDQYGQVLLTADILAQINARPDKFSIDYLDWNPEKNSFIKKMEKLFRDTVIISEKNISSYDFINSAMKRWYVSLPKYSKEMKVAPDGEQVSPGYIGLIKLLRQNPSGHKFLFEDIPHNFGFSEFVVDVADNITAAKKFYDEAVDRLQEHLTIKIKEIFIPANKKRYLDQMSLTSIIKDWCETLDPKVFEQLFTDGTDRYLSLFRSISNDESAFVGRIAKATTELRLEDWNDQTIEKCIDNLIHCKNTAESFHQNLEINLGKNNTDINSSSYQIVFTNSEGIPEVRRFERIDTSGRAMLLLNKISADLDSFGQAVTEAEKRQVLMEILKRLC